MTPEQRLEYRDYIGHRRAIQDIPTCLCSHPSHRGEKCAALACGCLLYRPDRSHDGPEAA